MKYELRQSRRAETLVQVVQHLSSLDPSKDYDIEFTARSGTRTDQQRKAIEVYCRELAAALNDAGLDQRAVMAKMKEGVEIPWSQRSCKDVLWRELQKAMLEKESTTNLTRAEVSRVYEVLNKWVGETLGVHVPFPERPL